MNSFTTISFGDILSFLSSHSKERIFRILGYINLPDNDTSIFDRLPNDILFIILQNLDCDELVLTYLISSKFNKLSQKDEFTQILRNKLRERTRLNLDHYNKKELIFLTKYTVRINISAAHWRWFYIKDGKTYAFGEINNLFKTDIPVLVSTLNTNIKQISASDRHALALTEEGHVYSLGYNHSGQLGLEKYDHIDKFTLIPGLKNIIQISTANEHSLLLSQNGKIYSFGSGRNGQLGHGDCEERIRPTLVPNINNVVQVSAGESTSLLLTKNGEIYAFGDNTYGKLGLAIGDCKSQTVPTLIPMEYFNNSPIVQVSAGAYHSLALSIDGNVYSFGCGDSGRLGLGDNNDRNRPTLIPANYFNNQRVSHISAGVYFSLIVTENGQLYSFGDEFHQQLGIKENYRQNVPTLINGFENVIDVSLGGSGYLMVNKYGEIHYMSKSYKLKEMIYAPVLLDKIS
jgi:hypothetical protein